LEKQQRVFRGFLIEERPCLPFAERGYLGANRKIEKGKEARDKKQRGQQGKKAEAGSS